MNTFKWTAAVTAAGLFLASAPDAKADHGYRYQQAVSVSGYASPRHPSYDYAQVLSSEPIVRYVTVRAPVRECWEEMQYYTVRRPVPGAGAGTLVGAVVGGVIGHQFGSGRGNDAATIAGTLIGAAVGNDAARRRYGADHVAYEHAEPVQRCETRIAERQEERIDGYRVTYRYNGQRYVTEMPYDPGRELRVRVDIRPAG